MGREVKDEKGTESDGFRVVRLFQQFPPLIFHSFPRLPDQCMAQPPNHAIPTDVDLIAAWRDGDEQAAAELVRRHTRALGRFLSALGAAEADLDDFVQEAFVRAFRGLGRFRGQCQFRTWLFTIGSNVVKDAGRRAKRGRTVPLDEEFQAHGGDPHEQAVASETAQKLEQGLAQLPHMQREVFLLRAQQGLEYSEIAAALATSEGAARVHYHHAVKRLREYVR